MADERPFPFEVTEKYLENIINQAGKVSPEQSLLKPEITSIIANGYNVNLSQVLEKDITKLELSLLDTTISKRIEKIIKKSIQARFTGMEISIFGFAALYLNQIKRLYSISQDFIFLNFSGHFSELGLVVDNKIEAISAIAFGVDSFLEKMIAEKIAKNISEADYLLNLFLLEKLDTKTKKQMDILLKKEKKLLDSFLKENIFNDDTFIPKTVFLISSNVKDNFLFKKLGLFDDIFTIDRALLRDFVDFGDTEFDNFIALEGQFIFRN